MKPIHNNDGWQAAMDKLIIKNSNKAKISVSFSSLENLFDQYHRNANSPVQSNDLIKLPVLIHTLDLIDRESFDVEEVFKINASRLEANLQGMLGEEDEGKFFSGEKIIEALALHNDNAATNILIDRFGRDELNSYFKAEKFSNIYLLDYLNDHTKNKFSGASNFISAGDLLNYEKKIISQLNESRKGKQLVEKYFYAYRSFEVDKLKGIRWAENTQISKGVNYCFSGDDGFVLVILISNYTDESQAANLLEEAEKIFFSNYNLVSSN